MRAAAAIDELVINVTRGRGGRKRRREGPVGTDLVSDNGGALYAWRAWYRLQASRRIGCLNPHFFLFLLPFSSCGETWFKLT